MAETPIIKLNAIEAARGAAAVAVVLYHAAHHIEKVNGHPVLWNMFQFGHAGVDLFFVLSGFIIMHVHHKDIGSPTRLSHYLGRRLTRVIPTYWVALFITVLMLAVGGHPWPDLWTLAKSLFLLPQDAEPILGVAWTLTYEIVFYALFGLWLLAIVATWIGWLPDLGLPQSILGIYNLEFFLGMSAAIWLGCYRVPHPRVVLAIGCSLFALAAISEDIGWLDGYGAWGRMAYGLSSVLILLGAIVAGASKAIRIPALLQTFGSASYSLYLFLFIFIGAAWQVWVKAGVSSQQFPLASFMLLSASGVVGGVLMSRLVEYPLMRWLRNGGKRQRIKEATV